MKRKKCKQEIKGETEYWTNVCHPYFIRNTYKIKIFFYSKYNSFLCVIQLNKCLEQMFNKEQTYPEVKQRILDVARDLFIKNGYKSTSIRDIATASETNVAMVNYYFRSKYNLFEIIFEEAFLHLQEKIFTTLMSDLPFFELVETAIHSYYEMLLKYPQIPVFILNEINQNPEHLSARVRKIDPYGVFMRMSERIREEEKKGTIKETPPVDFLLNVLSLCVFPFIFRILGMNVANVSQEEYTQMIKDHEKYVVQFVINALKK